MSDETAREAFPTKLLQRRLLVAILCFGYVGALSSLWYVWRMQNEPFTLPWFQAVYNHLIPPFNLLWAQLVFARFAPTLCFLTVIGLSYLRLQHIMNRKLGWHDRELDERQRTLRDKAHRIAYKIIAFACLAIPLFIGLANIYSPLAPRPVATLSTIQTYIAVSNASSTLPNTIIVWSVASPVQSPGGTGDLKHLVITMPEVTVSTQTVGREPQNWFNQEVFFALLLLTILVIFYTLPKAVIAWKER